MNTTCGREWTRQHISELFPATFINKKLRDRREHVLFEQERALMPATQPLVENVIQRRRYQDQVDELQKRITIMVRERNDIVRRQYEVGRVRNAERAEFVRACPDPECRGYLSTQWKCGVCEKWSCPDCHEVKGFTRDVEHVCNPDTLATARLLSNDTKPCPNCRTGIFKIDGCFGENVPVLLWSRETKMSQDIVVGDILIGDDGRPRRVERTVTGEDDLYEVQQDEAENYIVSSKHKLVLKYGPACEEISDELYEAFDSEEVVEIAVDDYMNLSHIDKHMLSGYKPENLDEIQSIIAKTGNPFSHLHADATMTSIKVVKLGRGKYYGWEVDKNKRFLLGDFTVARNCDQMWCTQCHTAFNWRTGRVEQVVHNPHYFEWLRRNGNAIPRNPGDIPCQQDLTHRVYINIRSLLTENYATHPKCNSSIDLLTILIRNTIHLRLTVLPRYAPVDRVQRNEELRVQYMLNNVSEDDFKTTLQRNEKKYNKNQEIYHVLEVLSNTITEIVFRFQTRLTNVDPLDDILPILDEINVIVVYVNNCLRDIGKAYACKTLCFSDKIEMRSV
jgi:hypothetical protein